MTRELQKQTKHNKNKSRQQVNRKRNDVNSNIEKQVGKYFVQILTVQLMPTEI